MLLDYKMFKLINREPGLTKAKPKKALPVHGTTLERVLSAIKLNPRINTVELVVAARVSASASYRATKSLKDSGLILLERVRIDPNSTGNNMTSEFWAV